MGDKLKKADKATSDNMHNVWLGIADMFQTFEL